jgi:uncharacterized membrane protein
VTAVRPVGERRGAGPSGVPNLEHVVARLLTIGTYASVALLAVGVALMAVAGTSPLAGGPPMDPATIVDDLAALRPEGFLWLGVVVVVATPSARVLASLVGYVQQADRAMAVVAALILGVIALSVALGASEV